MRTLLKNGTVLDYASNTNEVMDVLINDSKIEKSKFVDILIILLINVTILREISVILATFLFYAF